MKITHSCFIYHPACYLHASLSISSNFQVCKKQSIVSGKNTPKNQRELNGIEVIYIAVVVVLIFTLSFFNYSLFYFILFHFIFLPSTFSGTHVHNERTGSYARLPHFPRPLFHFFSCSLFPIFTPFIIPTKRRAKSQ